MNREEFLEKLDYFDFDSFGKDDNFDNSDVFEVVRFFANKIYNDFEKEKEIITRGILNKTCENCRNYINYHKVCREDVTFYKQKQLPKTFGCNKWVQNVI